MKIEVIVYIPVHQNHGITKGRIFETVSPPPGYEDYISSIWVLGDLSTKIRLSPSEFEVVNNAD